MKMLSNPWVWGAAIGGWVVGIMALDGRFGASVQSVAVQVRDMTRFGTAASG